MSTPLLDIVIVNWNSGELLKNCLASIAASKRDGFHLSKVVIVDNASVDTSLEGLDRLGLPLLIIRNSTNRGFAAACNQGARAGNSDYILFFNPDAMLYEDTLLKTLAFMGTPESAQIGICGVRLLDENGNMSPSCYRFPTFRGFLGKATNLSKLFSRLLPTHQMSESELSRNRIVDQVIGAFFLVRRKVYDLLKGFDERFFVYFEEVDFSFRAKQMGFESYYLSYVSAYHRGCGTTEQVKAKRLFYSLRSRIQYASKHFSKIHFALTVLQTCTVELVARLSIAIVRGSFAEIANTIEGYRKLFTYFLRTGKN